MKIIYCPCELPASRVPIGGNFSVLQSHPLSDPIFLSYRTCGYFVGQFFSTAVFGIQRNGTQFHWGKRWV